MDHDVVVRQKMTERYLLGELDPEARNEFEEHYFDCQDCALDVRAGALFVEQSKVALAEESENKAFRVPVPAAVAVKPGWLTGFRGILRPAFAVPVMALLLAVIGYQNLVTFPHLQAALNSPQVLPWAQVNVGTYGSEGPVIKTQPGKGFLLFVRIPPEGGYSHYTADLCDPAGKVEWSVTIPVTGSEDRVDQDRPNQDLWPLQVPGANWRAGNYSLKVRGITTAGQGKEVGQASFELQIQK
jgi:hypothetical protein